MLDTHWLVAKQLSVAVDVGAQIHHTAKVSYAFTMNSKKSKFQVSSLLLFYNPTDLQVPRLIEAGQPNKF